MCFKEKKEGRETTNESIDLEGILNYSDIGDLVSCLHIVSKHIDEDTQKRFKKIASIINPIIPARNRICHSRPLEPEDFPLICSEAKKILKVDSRFKETTETLNNLRNQPEIYEGIEIPNYWEKLSESCFHNLPLPDFEDTNFIGRKDELKKLKRNILEGHSIISVTGEGGLGKTAIALKLAYSILDEDCPFEAIVWVSLKTRTLMPNNIQPINEAITDVRAMTKKIGEELGVPSNSDPSEEIVSYLNEFKTLLIIDNLETIDPSSVINILENIQGGTRVLITSRKGIGQLERVFPLKRFPIQEAKILFKTFASLLNQTNLLKLDDNDLSKTIHKLYYNPLAIKWYVGSVAEGGDRLKLLESKNQMDLLEYCFKNIFDGLSQQGKKILQVLYCARRKISSAELLFCVGEDLDDIPSYTSVIRILYSLNVITSKVEEGYTSNNLTEFCRSYMKENASVNEKSHKSISKSLALIREAKEFSNKYANSNIFNPKCIITRNPEEEFISSFLISALKAKKKNKIGNSLEFCERAISYAPRFGESYRIKAHIFEQLDQLDDAMDAFEALMEVEPDNPRYCYMFSIFLASKFNDSGLAVEYAKKAYEAYSNKGGLPDSVLLQYAWLLTRVNKFPEAENLYETIILGKFIDQKNRRSRMAISQATECYRRAAEEQKGIHDIDKMFDFIDRCLSLLGHKKNQGDWDEKLQKVADKTKQNISYYKHLLSDEQLQQLQSSLDGIYNEELPIGI